MNKKSIINVGILFFLIINISFVSAIWWNPFTWFSNTNINEPNYVFNPYVQNIGFDLSRGTELYTGEYKVIKQDSEQLYYNLVEEKNTSDGLIYSRFCHEINSLNKDIEVVTGGTMKNPILTTINYKVPSTMKIQIGELGIVKTIPLTMEDKTGKVISDTEFFNGTKGDIVKFCTNWLNPYIDTYIKIGDNSTIIISQKNFQSDSILKNVTSEIGKSNYTHLSINDSNLILYYSFDGDAINTARTTVYDLSGNNNDGTAGTGVVINDSFGYYWNGAFFPYTQAGKIYRNSISLSNFTLSTWVKWGSIGANDNLIGEFDTSGWLWRSGYTGDNSYLQFFNGATAYDTSAGVLTAGNWMHLIVTYDGSYYRMYKNGANIYNSSASQAGITQRTTLTIGGLPDGASGGDGAAGYSINGTLDEVMIFNRSLSSSEVLAIYNNQSGRFFNMGTQELPSINISKDIDIVNISIAKQSLLNTNISSQICYWNVTKGYNNSDFMNKDGLQAYYHLDGDTSDAMGNYNGKLEGNGVFNVSGVYNSSFNTNKVGIINLTARIVNRTTNISLCVWLKGNGGRIIHNDWDFIFEYDGGNNRLGYTGGYGTYSATNSVPDNQWTYGCVVIQNSSYCHTNFYVNGVLSGTAEQHSCSSSGQQNLNRNLRLGRSSTTYNMTFDEVMIFNRSLTADEIKELYNRGRSYYECTAEINLSSTGFVQHLVPNQQERFYPKFNFQSDGFYTPYILNQINMTLYTQDSLVISIISPLAKTYLINITDFNVSTNRNTSWCGYSLNGASNVTMTKYEEQYWNATLTQLEDNLYMVIFSCNDTFNNYRSVSRNFAIDTIPPSISLNYPLTTTYIGNRTIMFNFTPTDNNRIASVQLWGNWTGIWHKNQTIVNPKSAILAVEYPNNPISFAPVTLKSEIVLFPPLNPPENLVPEFPIEVNRFPMPV